MSTSDQQGPLTRKQLRELRMTGSTPVITAEEQEQAAPPAPPAPPLPRAAEPAAVPPAPVPDAAVALGAAPLTRRQAREQERIKTASVPVIGEEDAEKAEADAVESGAAPTRSPAGQPSGPQAPAIVSEVPTFAAPSVAGHPDDDSAEADEAQIDATPVSAAAAVDTVGEVPLDETESEHAESDADDAEPGVEALGISVEQSGEEVVDADDVLSDVEDADDSDVTADERPTVSSAFGSGLLADGALADSAEEKKAFAPSFDELLTNDTTGSHVASNTLIFNPPAEEASLSGPVASTGEILVTGSYELPKGLGSQGHAHGTADGKDVDAVLIDGELPPASSPTPIAASSAISTIKPAGEVIRPPAPEKGNKLMLILAIVAGGLALAVGVAIVIAITTKVV